MAHLEGMLICDEAFHPMAGGAFLLRRPAPVDFTQTIDGWTVDLKRGSNYVLARRGTAIPSYDAVRDAAFSTAQKALDVLSVMRTADLSITNANNEHVAWWVDSGLVVLRVTAILTIAMSFNSKVEFRDATGAMKPLSVPPLPAWHPSFRFYRLAQATDDLFDAYRNMYLALEAVLDTIAPQKQKTSVPGSPPQAGENERDWLLRALTAAGAFIDLARFAPTGSSNPLQDIFNDLYIGTRTALFHAKGSRPFLLPHDVSQRERVLESLQRLGYLYCALAASQLGAKPGSGAMTIEGFKEVSKRWESGFRVLVTDDLTPFDLTSTTPSLVGGHVVALPTQPEPALDRPLVKSFLAAIHAQGLDELARVSRVVSSLDGKHALAFATIDGKLTLPGVGRFEAHVGIRQRNSRLPKTLYST